MARVLQSKAYGVAFLFDYVGMLDCSQIALSVAVQNVPLKAAQGKVVEYLSEHALESLLKQPNPVKRTELRNLFSWC